MVYLGKGGDMLVNSDTIYKLINVIDEQLAGLFEERMHICRKIGEYKKERALPVKDAARESAINAKSSSLIKDAEIEAYYIDFQKNNIKLSCALQEKVINGMKVAYSGVEGAYAYIAAKRMFPGAQLISYANFEPAYRAVEAGEADCAVLPLENSYAGDVGNVMDLAFSGSLFVNRVGELEIEHNLIVVPGTQLSDIRTVVSHPQALAQCDEYIKEHGFETREYSNTARAAAYVMEAKDPSVAAIASSDTAEIFGLEILEHKINTSANNTSRFAVFSRVQNRPPENDKNEKHSFIMVFTVPDEAGALAMTLDIIGAHGFNMKNLKSRPMKGLMWKYYFYVEGTGNINTQNGKDMLNELSVICSDLKLVGSYGSDII